MKPIKIEIHQTIEKSILNYRMLTGGINEPLDGDDVDILTEFLKCSINHHEGNLTDEEAIEINKELFNTNKERFTF